MRCATWGPPGHPSRPETPLAHPPPSAAFPGTERSPNRLGRSPKIPLSILIASPSVGVSPRIPVVAVLPLPCACPLLASVAPGCPRPAPRCSWHLVAGLGSSLAPRPLCPQLQPSDRCRGQKVVACRWAPGTESLALQNSDRNRESRMKSLVS